MDDLSRLEQRVFLSGYWFTLCEAIQSGWLLCNQEMPTDICGEDYDEEEQVE